MLDIAHLLKSRLVHGDRLCGRISRRWWQSLNLCADLRLWRCFCLPPSLLLLFTILTFSIALTSGFLCLASRLEHRTQRDSNYRHPLIADAEILLILCYQNCCLLWHLLDGHVGQLEAGTH